MPLTVTCGGCGNLLFFDDSMAGREASCRYCNRVIELPPPAIVARAPAESPVRTANPFSESPPPSGNPFSDGRSPFAGTSTDSDNPYAATILFPSEGKAAVRKRFSNDASRATRFLGALVDGVAGVAVMMGVAALLAATDVGGAIAEGAGFVAVFGLGLVQSVLIATRGQSLGKIVLGTRIANLDDDEIPDFVHSVLLRYWLPGLLGMVPFFNLIDALFIFGNDRRCLHDHMASTRVISLR